MSLRTKRRYRRDTTGANTLRAGSVRIFSDAAGAFAGCAAIQGDCRISDVSADAHVSAHRLLKNSSVPIVSVRSMLTIEFPDTNRTRNRVIRCLDRQDIEWVWVPPRAPGILSVRAIGDGDDIRRAIADMPKSVRVNETLTECGKNGAYHLRSKKFDKPERIPVPALPWE